MPRRVGPKDVPGSHSPLVAASPVADQAAVTRQRDLCGPTTGCRCPDQLGQARVRGRQEKLQVVSLVASIRDFSNQTRRLSGSVLIILHDCTWS